MKRFLIKGLFYGFFLVLFSLWADHRIRKIPNNYAYKDHLLHSSQPSTIDTLILGSSHSLKGIDPRVFGSEAFNYAHVSQSYDIDLAILNHLPDEKDLKAIILPVSLFSFFTTLGDGPEDFRLTSYGIYTDIDIKGSIFQKTGLNNWTIFRRYVLLLDSTLITIDENGWEKMRPSHSEQELETSSLKAFARHSSHEPEPSTKALEAFNSIIKYCLQNEIKLILVTMPAYSKYRELSLSSRHWMVTQEIISTILYEFPMITYVNYFERPINLEVHDFYDADHLSELGAIKLSVDLAERIVVGDY